MHGVGSSSATVGSPLAEARCQGLAVVRDRALVAGLALAVGLAVVVPLVALARDALGGATLPRAFDEDAYYTFSVARNLAQGHGLTADGSQLTSGVQPLWTIGLAPAFLLPERAAFALIAALSATIWVAAAITFGRIVRRVLTVRRLRRPETALLAAFVFVVDPNLRTLFLNGLETGLALLLLLVIVDRFVLVPPGSTSSGRRRDLGFGVALGLLLLARVDAVLLVGALLLARVLIQQRRRRLVAVALPGAVAASLLAPWLLFSLAATGSLLPQGGAATSGGIYQLPLGEHVRPALDAATAWLWWPRPWRGAPELLGILSVGLLGVAASVVWRSRDRVRPRAGASFGLLVAAAVATGAGYTVASSALWFYGRYFVVLRVAVLLALAVAVVATVDRRPSVGAGARAGLAAIATVVAVLVTDPRPEPYLYAETESIAASTPLDRCGRIGMFESGRSGFAFPDRVVNLDGKTNLQALEAFRDHRLLDYIADEGLDVVVVLPGWPELLARHGERWTESFDLVADPLGSDGSYLVRRGTPCAAGLTAASES